MRGGRRLGLIASAIVAGGAGLSIALLVGRGGGGDGSPDPFSAVVVEPEVAASTPIEAVELFYEAMRRGDCETAGALQTEALSESIEDGIEGPDCAALAVDIERDPDRVDRVLPQVTDLQVEYENGVSAVVRLMFDFRVQADVPAVRFLIQDGAGRWKLASMAEVMFLAPEYFRQQVQSADDVIVFLEYEVSDAERQAIEEVARAHPAVVAVEYMDSAASEAEARELFADNPAMLDRIDEAPELLPTSYRLQLSTTDETVAREIVELLDPLPGAMRVRSPHWPPLPLPETDEA